MPFINVHISSFNCGVFLCIFADNLLDSINEDNKLSPPERRQAWTIMESDSLIGAGEGVRRRNTG